MKVVLYFPPLAPQAVISPYPSLPILCGRLKSSGGRQVVARDANADLIWTLCRKAEAQRGRRGSPNPRAGLGGPLEGLRRAFIRTRGSRFERCLQEGIQCVERDVGIEADRNRALKACLGRREGPRFESAVTRSDVLEAMDDRSYLPLLETLGDAYFEDATQGQCVLVGLSVAYMSQLGFAVAISRLVKRRNPRSLVIIGGAAIRHIVPSLCKVKELFRWVDCFCETEGENVLEDLADCLESDRPWSSVRGIIFQEEGGRLVSTPAKPFTFEVDRLPDFSLLEAHRYLRPGMVHLRTSVGCYYNGCAFCTIPRSPYRERSIPNVLRDVRAVMEEHGARHVCFSDEGIPWRRLEDLAEGLLRTRTRVRWEARSRLDPGSFTESTCRKMRASGCSVLNFGLESGCQRVNDRMDKGVRVDEAERILRRLHRAGIRCYLNAIVGFPGETEAEAAETIRFLNRMGRFAAAEVSGFALTYGSRVYRNPSRYGIRLTGGDDDCIYRNDHEYACPTRIPDGTLSAIILGYRNPLWNRVLRRARLSAYALRTALGARIQGWYRGAEAPPPRPAARGERDAP